MEVRDSVYGEVTFYFQPELSVLASICAFCAVLGAYRAIKNRNEELELTKNGERVAATTDLSPHTVKHQPQWISAADLSQMMSVESGHGYLSIANGRFLERNASKVTRRS